MFYLICFIEKAIKRALQDDIRSSHVLYEPISGAQRKRSNQARFPCAAGCWVGGIGFTNATRVLRMWRIRDRTKSGSTKNSRTHEVTRRKRRRKIRGLVVRDSAVGSPALWCTHGAQVDIGYRQSLHARAHMRAFREISYRRVLSRGIVLLSIVRARSLYALATATR